MSTTGTAEIATSAHLPRLLGDISRLHLGYPLALAVALAIWVWLARLRTGFETRAVGLGAEAARAAGIPVGRRTLEAMGLAGALAGLAGAVLVLGTELRYPGTTPVSEIVRTATDVPEVVQVFTIAGDPDALIHVRVRDLGHLQQVIDRLRRAGDVTGTKTLLVLGSWTRDTLAPRTP